MNLTKIIGISAPVIAMFIYTPSAHALIPPPPSTTIPARPSSPPVGIFTLNMSIKLGATKNVRSSAGTTTGSLLGTQPLGAQGRVIQLSPDTFWLRINFNTGVDGWVTKENVIRI